MIVGPDFIWLHFPKCAGHAVESALRRGLRGRRDVVFDRRWPHHHPGWHESVADREQHVDGFARHDRTVISGFRRLPHWMLSRVHFEAARPPHHVPTRDMLRRGEFLHQNGKIGVADHQARHFAGSVDRWIRTEHLAEDFERHFSDILGARAKLAMSRVNKVVNAAPLNYIKALEFHFTPDDLETLYAANPVWANIERELYGDLLRL